MHRSSSLRSTLNTSYITGVLRLFLGITHRRLVAWWGTTMAPCNGTTSTPPTWPSPSDLPSPTIAHDNGTLQWHHVHSPKVGHLPPHGYTMAPRPPRQCWSASTLQWHSMAPWCHVQSSKVVRRPPPLLKVR